MKVETQVVRLTRERLNQWTVPELGSDVTERGEGLHVSTVIRDIAIRTGVLKQEQAGRRTLQDGQPGTVGEDGPPGNLLALGLAWEAWVAGLYPEMIWQPGEVERDGLYMNPDGLSMVKGNGWMVEEFKFTRKSSKVKGMLRRIEGEWMWLAQVKAYCHAVGAKHARLHAMYVNGDYTFGGEDGEPAYVVYRMEFSEKELEDNWAVLMQGAERLREKGVHGE